MGNRKGVIAGTATSIATVVMLITAAAVMAAAEGQPGAGYGYLLTITGLLGTASVGIWVSWAVRRTALGYVVGVRQTVDRLAEALPPPRDED